MSVGRVSVVSLAFALCLALLAATLPAAVSAAAKAREREYIVTIAVKDSGRLIKPSDRSRKVRIRQRAKAARLKTSEIAQRNGVKTGHRYDTAFTGFSARMTRAQARKLARDPGVSEVRVARTIKLTSQTVPNEIDRVMAYPGGPRPDVQANVAVIDSGIGPTAGNTPGQPRAMTTNELAIAGGINCYDDPSTRNVDEAQDQPGNWGDVLGHGTHVAGIIGARDNGVGTVGVAPGANLWSVRAFGPLGFGSESALLCGLDWVLDTHRNNDPQKIDVVNMSLETGRVDSRESCGAGLTDPMQILICDLVGYGVPVVAAAGNSGSNANDVAPGGFDQVITVGAMTDTDGTGKAKGPRASCSTGWGEKDDAFASYSNFGPDIDIVAPGTCVRSTWYADPSGDQLATSTGTSMAAPFVSGAIARYVDAKGSPATVGQIRQFIRAAGRSDWDLKSDPLWYGINDPDPPNRVLDVAALTGGDAIRTFLYRESLVVAGKSSGTATRVDIQRSGGYADAVDLSTVGLARAAGTSSFDKSSLDGLGKQQLGTNVRFDLDPSGPDGIYDVSVTASSAADSHARNLRLTVDRTKPTVSGLAPRVRGQRTGMSPKGATQVYLQWNARDNLSGIKSAQLQRKTGTAAWRDAGTGGTSSSRVYLKPGQDNRFRVKATDKVGNTRTSASIRARLSVRDSRSSQWTRSGAWRTKRVDKAYGGSLLVATAGTASLRTTFKGKATAIVAPVGNGRGKFRVRVDGGGWKTVSTMTRSGGQRKVVWSRKLNAGVHTLEIQRVAGKPAIDGLVIVR